MSASDCINVCAVVYVVVSFVTIWLRIQKFEKEFRRWVLVAVGIPSALVVLELLYLIFGPGKGSSIFGSHYLGLAIFLMLPVRIGSDHVIKKHEKYLASEIESLDPTEKQLQSNSPSFERISKT